MNSKRLLIASLITIVATAFLFIQKLPTSGDYPKEEVGLSVMNASLEKIAGQATMHEEDADLLKISYQIEYQVETSRLKKNITLLHQLSSPIALEESALPRECSYDFELTITCIYQENSYYVDKQLEMLLAYDRDLLDEPVMSKVFAYASYENKKSEGVEQSLTAFTDRTTENRP